MADTDHISHGRAKHGPGNGGDNPRLTIRQLREAAQKEALAKEVRAQSGGGLAGSSQKNTLPAKKKPGLFGGIFQIREPTQIALNQVAAQMIAQHGSTSATKVPNVRLEKMPDHVPKVNTRWDGVPESAKQMEKREKQRQRDRAKRESFFSTDFRPHSGGRDFARSTDSANSSATTTSSFGVFGNSSGSQGASSRSGFYARSVNSSGDLASQQRSGAQRAFGESTYARPSSAASTSGSQTGHGQFDAERMHAATSYQAASVSNYPGRERPTTQRSSSTVENDENMRVWSMNAQSDTMSSARSHGASPISHQLQPVIQSPPARSPLRLAHQGSSQQNLGVLPITGKTQSLPKKAVHDFDDAFLAGEAQELTITDNGSSSDGSTQGSICNAAPSTIARSRQETQQHNDFKPSSRTSTTEQSPTYHAFKPHKKSGKNWK